MECTGVEIRGRDYIALKKIKTLFRIQYCTVKSSRITGFGWPDPIMWMWM